MIRAITRSQTETQELAGKLSAYLVPSDVVLLVGDLGAGKTTFIQGVCAAFGVGEPVLSPTFVIAHHYEGIRDAGGNPTAIKIHHLDLYRIEDREADREEMKPFIWEFSSENDLLMVEWGDKLGENPLSDYLELRFEFGDPSQLDERIVSLKPVGPKWSDRVESLKMLATGDLK